MCNTELYVDCNGDCIDTGSTAFMIVGIAFVALQTPAAGLAQAGSIKRKNALSMLMQTLIGMVIGTLLWFLIGFSLTFGKSRMGGLIGWESEFILFNGLPHFGCLLFAPTIPALSYASFQMMFALMTPVIVTGSWAEKMRFEAFLIFTALWPLLVYYPLAHWIWGGGWLYKYFGVYDFAGGIVIHTSAGVAGFTVACMLTRRRPTDHLAFHNLPLSYIGNVLVFVAWYFFNGSSAVAANFVAATALVNTHLAACTAGLVWTLLIYFTERPKRWRLTEFMGGMLAGLGSITPNSGFVSPYSALVIGFIGGLTSWYANRMIIRANIDDVLAVGALQGVPGGIGSILLGLFADPRVYTADYVSGDTSINPVGIFFASGDKQVNDSFKFFGGQIFAVVFTIIWTSIFTYLLMKFIHFTVGNDVDHYTEEIGLDMKQIGEQAYDDSLDVVLDLGEEASAALLIEAAASGHLTEVDRLIRGGVHADASDYDDRTPLMLAAAEGRITVVRYLVERHHVKVNYIDKFGNTALVEAIKNRRQQISQYLVDHGATLPSELGGEMLIDATSNANEDYKLVSILLKAKVDPNSCDYDKRTPLMFATCAGHYSTVALLLDFNADVNQRDRWGRTCYDDAKEFKKVDIIALLKEENSDLSSSSSSSSRVNKNRSGSKNSTLLKPLLLSAEKMEDESKLRDEEKRRLDVRDACQAVANGNLAELKRLQQRGVNFLKGEYDGRTPLHIAAASGKLDILRYLVSLNGMNINVVDRFRMTPLAEAIANGHDECAKLLRSAGGSTQNRQAGPKLCAAAAKGDLRLLRKFRDLGYDMKVGDADLRTALMLASAEGHLKCVEFLIKECGVDIDAKDRFGNTALTEATHYGHNKIVHLLKESTNKIIL